MEVIVFADCKLVERDYDGGVLGGRWVKALYRSSPIDAHHRVHRGGEGASRNPHAWSHRLSSRDHAVRRRWPHRRFGHQARAMIVGLNSWFFWMCGLGLTQIFVKQTLSIDKKRLTAVKIRRIPSLPGPLNCLKGAGAR